MGFVAEILTLLKINIFLIPLAIYCMSFLDLGLLSTIWYFFFALLIYDIAINVREQRRSYQKNDNLEKSATQDTQHEEKQNENTTQYMSDTTTQTK